MPRDQTGILRWVATGPPDARCAEIGQFCTQDLAITVTGVVAHVGAAGRPDLHQTLGSEHPDGGLGRVQRNSVAIPELPVRRYPATRWACPTDDFGPENIGESVARKAVQLLGHTTTITDRPKTDTHCRQCVGGDLTTRGPNCPRAARVLHGSMHLWWPPQRCPSCGTLPEGAPVVFWCTGYGCRVGAADLDAEPRPLVKQGRAR
jgi:hypothetical protein